MKFSAIYGWLLVEVQYKRDRESRNETPRERLPGYSGRYFRADPFRSLLVGLRAALIQKQNKEIEKGKGKEERGEFNLEDPMFLFKAP